MLINDTGYGAETASIRPVLAASEVIFELTIANGLSKS